MLRIIYGRHTQRPEFDDTAVVRNVAAFPSDVHLYPGLTIWIVAVVDIKLRRSPVHWGHQIVIKPLCPKRKGTMRESAESVHQVIRRDNTKYAVGGKCYERPLYSKPKFRHSHLAPLGVKSEHTETTELSLFLQQIRAFRGRVWCVIITNSNPR